MAVNWLWKHKVGEIIFRDNMQNENWKLEMFGGNMMCAFIYRYTITNEKTGKRERMYNFISWLNDINHAKRCFKDTKLEDLIIGDHYVKKVRLCVTSEEFKYSNQEMLKFGQLLATLGYKVELY